MVNAHDDDALLDHVAAALWNATDPETPWPDAGSYWQSTMKRQASAAIDAMRSFPCATATG